MENALVGEKVEVLTSLGKLHQSSANGRNAPASCRPSRATVCAAGSGAGARRTAEGSGDLGAALDAEVGRGAMEASNEDNVLRSSRQNPFRTT